MIIGTIVWDEQHWWFLSVLFRTKQRLKFIINCFRFFFSCFLRVRVYTAGNIGNTMVVRERERSIEWTNEKRVTNQASLEHIIQQVLVLSYRKWLPIRWKSIILDIVYIWFTPPLVYSVFTIGKIFYRNQINRLE